MLLLKIAILHDSEGRAIQDALNLEASCSGQGRILSMNLLNVDLKWRLLSKEFFGYVGEVESVFR